jgi:PAS domain-containing protein
MMDRRKGAVVSRRGTVASSRRRAGYLTDSLGPAGEIVTGERPSAQTFRPSPPGRPEFNGGSSGAGPEAGEWVSPAEEPSRKGRSIRRALQWDARIAGIGLVLAATYWVLESLMDSTVFHQGPFLSRLLAPDLLELWMRASVLGLFFLAWFVVNHFYLRLQESSKHLEQDAALFDLAQDAIFVRGLDDRILTWNKGAEEVYGWTKEEALGSKATELLSPECGCPRRRSAKSYSARDGGTGSSAA